MSSHGIINKGMEVVHAQQSFWKENHYPYLQVVEIPESELLILMAKLSRTDIIEWLMWNDRNGIYSDEASIREFGQVMTIEDAREIMTRQADGNRIVALLKIV
jgi:hypothetical protein